MIIQDPASVSDCRACPAHQQLTRVLGEEEQAARKLLPQQHQLQARHSEPVFLPKLAVQLLESDVARPPMRREAVDLRPKGTSRPRRCARWDSQPQNQTTEEGLETEGEASAERDIEVRGIFIEHSSWASDGMADTEAHEHGTPFFGR